MQYQVMLAIADVEDILALADLLKPIKDIQGVKVVTAVPRPEAQAAAQPTAATRVPPGQTMKFAEPKRAEPQEQPASG